MLSYCHIVQRVEKYKKYKSKSFKTDNGKIMLSSKRAMCQSKKSRFIKEQEANGLSRKLGIKTPLSKIPLLDEYFVLKNYFILINY